MKKYVVYLTHYKGDLLPPYYIGSTTEEKILSGDYFGSVRSKKWKNNFYYEIEINKDLFEVKILSYHNSRIEALEEELRIQIINDVVKSTDYFNESLASINGYFGHDVSGKNHPQYGKKLSEEQKNKFTFKGRTQSIESRRKISESNKGKKLSEETKEKISQKHIGYKYSDETKLKMAESKIGNKNSFYGKKHSEETKNKNSNKMKQNYELLSEEDKLNNILNQKGRKSILQFDFYGNFISEYLSLRQMEKLTGYKRSSVICNLKGKTKQSYGYIWKYKNE